MLKLFLISGTSIIITTVVVASNFPSITNWAISFTVFATAATSMSGAFYSGFQAHHKLKLVSILTLVGDIGTSIAIILLLSLGYSLFAVLWSTLALSIVTLLFSIIVARKVLGFTFGQESDSTLWRRLLQESYPIALSSVGISMYLYLSSSMLKYMKGDEIIGYYGAALKIVIVFALIPNAFSQVMYPVLSALYAQSSTKLASMLQTSVRFLFIIALPLSVGTVLIADKLMVTLFTEAFRPAIISLKILMVANLFSYPNWLVYAFLTSIKRQRFQMVISLAMGVFTALINYFLIPRYGLLVPSASLAFVEIILFGGAVLYLRTLDYKLNLKALFTKPLAATGVMAVVVGAASMLPMSAQIALGIVSFSMTFLFIGGILEQDRPILEKIFPFALPKWIIR